MAALRPNMKIRLQLDLKRLDSVHPSLHNSKNLITNYLTRNATATHTNCAQT